MVVASQGMRGGCRLARAPHDIAVLGIVAAIEGPKPLFDCHEVRWRCAVFEGEALACKAPAAFGANVQQWLSGRGAARGARCPHDASPRCRSSACHAAASVWKL